MSRRSPRALVLLALTLTLVPGLAQAQTTPREVVAEIRVHGNQVATDADIIALTGVHAGDVMDAETISHIVQRLRDARKFEKVEVLKRFASIDDPSQIVIVVIVDEGPVTIHVPELPGHGTTVTRRRGVGNLMFLPILDSEDGYGFTYGVRFAYPNPLGPHTRLSFPLSLGGDRQVGAEFERAFTSRAITRVIVGANLDQRTNPFYKTDDTRRHAWVTAERVAGPVRLDVTAAQQTVRFDSADESFHSIAAAATVDTRLDPFLARNAVFATAGVQRDFFNARSSLVQRHYEARGYLGFIGQSIVVLDARRDDSNGPVPAYLEPLLGGVTNLRGFEAGTGAGDTLVAGSAELRVPLTTPLSVAKFGVSAFVDTGAVYGFGQRLRDQDRLTGVGGAAWLTAAVFHMSLSVAHGIGAHTRVQFDIGFGF